MASPVARPLVENPAMLRSTWVQIYSWKSARELATTHSLLKFMDRLQQAYWVDGIRKVDYYAA